MSEHPLIDERMLPGIRWTILRTVRIGGHLGASESMLRQVLRAEWLGVTTHLLRDQLHYLEQRGLVTITRSEVKDWEITLDRYGYDVVDYQVTCDAGIDRPPRSHSMD